MGVLGDQAGILKQCLGIKPWPGIGGKSGYIGGIPLKAVIIQHQCDVPAGRVLEVLEELGWESEVILMEEGDGIPGSLEGFDCLVLLGGTMNVDDLAGYPYLEKLRLFTAGALRRDFPVLGLCLGAQMMSRAAGSRVHRGRNGEMGWWEVHFTGEGLEDRVLEGIESPLEVFHWHEDSFDLPPGAVLLGKSGRCPHQIIRIGEKSYGFQFHPEVDREIIVNWINTYRAEVENMIGPGGPEMLIRQTEEKMSFYHSQCRRMFINYFRYVGGQA